ncbi:unnamed protein product, partial [Mesorhabditis spiculigera]
METDGYDSFEDDDLQPGPSIYMQTQVLCTQAAKPETPRRRAQPTPNPKTDTNVLLLTNRLETEKRDRQKVEKNCGILADKLRAKEKEKEEALAEQRRFYETKMQNLNNTINELRFNETRVDVTMSSQSFCIETNDRSRLNTTTFVGTPPVNTRKVVAMARPTTYQAFQNTGPSSAVNTVKACGNRTISNTSPNDGTPRKLMKTSTGPMRSQVALDTTAPSCSQPFFDELPHKAPRGSPPTRPTVTKEVQTTQPEAYKEFMARPLVDAMVAICRLEDDDPARLKMMIRTKGRTFGEIHRASGNRSMASSGN